MPVLNSKIISNLQVMQGINGNYLLLDKFSYKQVQQVEQQRYIQGHIGTHVMDVGGMTWEAKLEAPLFVFDGPIAIDSTLDLLWYALSDPNFLLYRNYFDNRNVILKTGIITMGKENISTSIELISDNSFIPDVFQVTDSDFLRHSDVVGRVTKFYDSIIRIGEIGAYILSGVITFTIIVNTDWLINNLAPPAPYFSIHGFQISGNLKIAYNPEWGVVDIFAQIPNELIISTEGINLTLGSHWLFLNDAKIMYSNITKELAAGQLITADINFESYAPTIQLGIY